MPTPPNNGTGFVSLADYLGANGDALDAQYNKDSDYAHQVGDSFNGWIADVPGEAERAAKQTGAAADFGTDPSHPAGDDPYSNAVAAGQKAQDLAHQYSPAGMAGSATNPVSPEQGFNAALEQGAHGQDYASLAGYLGPFTPAAADAAWNAGSQKGISEWVDPNAPKPGAPPPEPRDPNQPPGERGSPTPDPGDPGRRRQGGY